MEYFERGLEKTVQGYRMFRPIKRLAVGVLGRIAELYSTSQGGSIPT